ncbi:hypothetical protein [Leptospira vanthielii]|uniref:Outer membrane protein beta-barrel domain-containing protein n=1 Tax=Leptospira vanthielii TaxID=293085 RepID=A0ABY2NU09_9LEPT|nr:hypothetical protein [Leptospira vanthielii]TGM61738.1 hypothetical protein EHQ95_00370 [Leptospira vanthielii]
MKKKILTIIIFALFISTPSYADEEQRKKIHIMISPIVIHSNLENSAREIKNSTNFQILYGFTSKLYLGLNYAIGKNPQQTIEALSTGSSSTARIYQYSITREAQTFTFNFQYFFWKSFYTSLNLGLEKGFSIDKNNFILIRNDYFINQPVAQKTIYDDRMFGTVGIGYREEFLNWFLLAFEYQRGYIESGKVNQHFTYNPEYYGNNLPFIVEQHLMTSLIFQSKKRNSEFQQIYISAGIAF